MDDRSVTVDCLCADMLHALQHRDDPQCHLSEAAVMIAALVAVLFFGGQGRGSVGLSLQVWLHVTYGEP